MREKYGDPQQRQRLACMGTVDLITYAIKLEEQLGSCVPPPPDRGMVEAAAKIASDWAEKFQTEADKPDQTKRGKEIRDCQVIAALRIADDIRALSTASQSQPERRAMAGADRLQAIIAELKSFPPSPLIEDAIDSLERIL